MRSDYADRRAHDRVNIEKAIYVEVVSRRSRSEAHNKIIRCETLDISVGGLRIWVPEAIAAGSVLNIAAPLDDWTESLELVGEAMWVKAATNRHGFWVGLALKDSSHEDMEKWFKVVHRLTKQP
ncbi:MAG: PilZ domain-containing protein [Halioglobus sp.]